MPGGPGRIDANPVIQFQRVTKAYGSITAVHETNLSVTEGEFFSLLGPSGCGKTTTLRLIAGFERPTHGRILLDGAEVSKVPPYRRNVNTVFQHYALFPHLSVFDNVAFGLRSSRTERSEIPKRVEEMLAVVHLPGLSQRKPGQLSGGQQQRVALARALVNRPRALLLDEPLGALDLKLRESMQAELKRIQGDTGSTFVYVTHDQSEALTMSDRIAVMNEGRTEQIGTPQEIYHRPASAFVASFIGHANLLPARVMGSSGTRVQAEIPGLGIFAASTSVDPIPSGPVLFMLRPEAIELCDEEPKTGNAVAVTLTEILFVGAMLRCVGRSTRGATLVAEIGPTAPGIGPMPGSQVWMSWSDGAATAVPIQTAQPQPCTANPPAGAPGERN